MRDDDSNAAELGKEREWEALRALELCAQAGVDSRTLKTLATEMGIKPPKDSKTLDLF